MGGETAVGSSKRLTCHYLGGGEFFHLSFADIMEKVKKGFSDSLRDFDRILHRDLTCNSDGLHQELHSAELSLQSKAMLLTAVKVTANGF